MFAATVTINLTRIQTNHREGQGETRLIAFLARLEPRRLGFGTASTDLRNHHATTRGYHALTRERHTVCLREVEHHETDVSEPGDTLSFMGHWANGKRGEHTSQQRHSMTWPHSVTVKELRDHILNTDSARHEPIAIFTRVSVATRPSFNVTHWMNAPRNARLMHVCLSGYHER